MDAFNKLLICGYLLNSKFYALINKFLDFYDLKISTSLTATNARNCNLTSTRLIQCKLPQPVPDVEF
jgi:hypothetical protein